MPLVTQVQTLTALSLNNNCLKYPSEDVVGGGIEAVMEWLRLERPATPLRSPEPTMEVSESPVAVPVEETKLEPLPPPPEPVLAPVTSIPDTVPLDDGTPNFTAAKTFRLPLVDDLWGDKSRPATAKLEPSADPASSLANGADEPVTEAEIGAESRSKKSPSPSPTDGASLTDAGPAQVESEASERPHGSDTPSKSGAVRERPLTGRDYMNPNHSDLFGQPTPNVPVLPLTPAQIQSARAASAKNRAEIEKKIRASSAKRRSAATPKTPGQPGRDVSSAR